MKKELVSFVPRASCVERERESITDHIALIAHPHLFAPCRRCQLCSWLLRQLIESQSPLSCCLLQPHAGETDSRRLVLAKRRLSYERLPSLLAALTDCVAARERRQLGQQQTFQDSRGAVHLAE